jgi:hypothetical protein
MKNKNKNQYIFLHLTKLLVMCFTRIRPPFNLLYIGNYFGKAHGLEIYSTHIINS